MSSKGRIVVSTWEATPHVAESALISVLEAANWEVVTIGGSLASVNWAQENFSWAIISGDLSGTYTAHVDSAVMDSFPVPIVSMSAYSSRVSLGMASSSAFSTRTKYYRSNRDARNDAWYYLNDASVDDHLLRTLSAGTTSQYAYQWWEGTIDHLIATRESGGYLRVHFGDYRFDATPTTDDRNIRLLAYLDNLHLLPVVAPKTKIVLSTWDTVANAAEDALWTLLESNGWEVDARIGSISNVAFTDDIAWAITGSTFTASTVDSHPDQSSNLPVNWIFMNRETAYQQGFISQFRGSRYAATLQRVAGFDEKNIAASVTESGVLALRHYLGVYSAPSELPEAISSDTIRHYSTVGNASSQNFVSVIEETGEQYTRIFWGDHRFDLATTAIKDLFMSYIGMPDAIPPTDFNNVVIAAGNNWVGSIDAQTGEQNWLIPTAAYSLKRNIADVDINGRGILFIGQSIWDSVAPEGTGVIYRLRPSGAEDWTKAYAGELRAIAVDSNDGSCVVVGVPDGHTYGMRKYSREGALIWEVTGHPDPSDICICPTTGNIFVCGAGTLPQKYDSDGSLVFTANAYTGFDSLEHEMPCIAVNNTSEDFVIGVYTGFVDELPGLVYYNSDGTVKWTDTLIVAASVAIDQIDGSVHAAGPGELDEVEEYYRPAARRYTSASGVVAWSVFGNYHINHVSWDPINRDVVYTGDFNYPNNLFQIVRLKANGDPVTTFSYSFYPFNCVFIGSEFVSHPTEATTVSITPTSATFQWEPPG